MACLSTVQDGILKTFLRIFDQMYPLPTVPTPQMNSASVSLLPAIV